MSDQHRARLAFAVAACALLGLPHEAAGQFPVEVVEQEAALARRIAELTPAHAAAESLARVVFDREVAVLKLGLEAQDTVYVGPLRIVTTADQVAEATRLWKEEWEFFAPLLGSRAGTLELATFIHHRQPRSYPYQVTANQVRIVEFKAPVSDREMRNAVHVAIGSMAALALPTELWEWSGGVGLDPEFSPARLYRIFVRAPTALAQACVAGSADACWTAVGEMDPTADVVSTWFATDEQRALVAEFENRVSSRPCVLGDDGYCRKVAEVLVRGGQTPFPASVHASLLWFAIERGGPGSVERLHSSIEADRPRFPDRDRSQTDAAHFLGPISDVKAHLARAAGMEPEVLVDMWRQGVLAGQPGTPAPEKRSRASTMLWVMLFGLLATRSTRWRLG